MGDKKQLTNEDIQQLKEFVAAVDALYAAEPIQITAEQWDVIFASWRDTGEIPAEYADKVEIIRDDKNGDAFRDKVWESWHAKEHELIEQYHDAILRALDISFVSNPEGGNVYDIIQGILRGDTADLPQVIAKQIKSVVFPVDKVNKNIWHLLEQPTDGQLTLNFDVSSEKDKKPVNILYALDFNKLENVSVTRKLEPYDKRVYLAISALFNEGYDVMSVQQIYTAMGYTGKASATDIKKINDAITKMNGAHLVIDNKYEAKSYTGYSHFKYDGVLLPMERMQAYINGQLADAAIHIFREPPMVSFAKQRKQVTTIDIKLLDSPISKTNANIELEDYLIEEIARIKKGSRNNCKMLFDTIYKNAHITTKMQRQRAPEKIKKLLEHYKNCGYIESYKMASDGITIKC